jgi:hypothetical protein
MPWTKSGDTAASYPRLLAVDELPDAEDSSVNEVTGFIVRLFFHSAGHMTDYEVGFGDIKLFGNGRHEHLVKLALATGLMTHISGRGRTARYRLVEDPEFMHLRKRAEVMWDRQRDADRRNPDLTMPVRLRDGDACRYCNQVVSWTDHKSGRGATYDHRDPGQPATVETYVVACRKCNGQRLNDPDADANLPLLPTPPIPIYQDKTRELLEKYFGPERVAARLGQPAPDTAEQRLSDPETPRTDTARPEGPATRQDGAARRAEAAGDPDGASADPGSLPGSRSGNRDGSGRVGPGLAGTGRDGSGQEGTGLAGSPPRKRGRRRGRRGKPSQPGEGT